MIDLLSTQRNKKKISVKYLILTFFVCVSMVAWLGITDLRADVDDPEDNTDEMNKAQTLRLENVANEAASQDPDESKNEEFYSSLIDKWRASGMGWGDIVHKLNRDYDLNIHPSVLGLGESKKSSQEAVQSSKHSSMQSGNNQGQGLALGHSKENNSNGGGNGGGKGGGNGGGKGGGKK